MEVIKKLILSNFSLALFLLSFSITFIILSKARNFFLRIGFVDVPNSRSNHRTPIPLGGGIIIIPIIILIGMLSTTKLTYINYLSLIILFLISLIDDIKNVNALMRLFFQMACVFFYVNNYLFYKLLDHYPLVGYFEITFFYFFALFGITWFINSFNFMDGIDGITSIQVIFIMSSLIILEYLLFSNVKDYYFIILGAMISFLYFNWVPAKIFLGDSGSISLGFLMSFFLIELSLKGYWTAAIILPMYYLVDTTITLLKRVFSGNKPWQSHSEHFYQMLVKGGKSHAEVCYYIIIISIGLFLLSMFSTFFNNNLIFLFLALLWCISFIYFFSKFKNNNKKK